MRFCTQSAGKARFMKMERAQIVQTDALTLLFVMAVLPNIRI